MDTLVEQVLAQIRQQQVQCMVIGASAGAIEVLGKLLPLLPKSCVLSVVAVIHIPADRESLLTGIFQNRCSLTVVEPVDKQTLEPAHLFFAPPGYHLLVEHDHVFSLSTDGPVHYSRPSVDVLFESAADAYGEQLVGVVLTGANRDGAAGLRAIHARGGVAIVQEPSEAEAAMMPESAREACPEAFTLSVAQLGQLFQRL